MGKAEQFISVVTCPECGRTGTATWEKDENPNASQDDDEGMLLEGVSDGFRFDLDSKIYCVDCGVEAMTGRSSK
jgi:hypothetical protein